jgi:thioester reductase-like protein
VSARNGKWTEVAREETTPSPSFAGRTGYARSKWVAEKICQRASEQRGIRTGILRLGQMVGDRLHGLWNETEAIPLIFKSVKVIGALPDVIDVYYMP